ncbi:hypothetical protein Tco_1464878 [Tanacetum coccineum]
MLDGKLILVDDDVKPLNKVDSDPVDSDSEHEVEVAYDERLNSWLLAVQNIGKIIATKTMTIYDTFYDRKGFNNKDNLPFVNDGH